MLSCHVGATAQAHQDAHAVVPCRAGPSPVQAAVRGGVGRPWWWRQWQQGAGRAAERDARRKGRPRKGRQEGCGGHGGEEEASVMRERGQEERGREAHLRERGRRVAVGW